MPLANWTNDDETAVALRMFRCGAATIDHSLAMGAMWAMDEAFGWHWQSTERQQKYIFGWPATGGVWVLQLPPLLDKHNSKNFDLVEEAEQHYRHMNGDPAISRNVDGSIYYGDLVKSETMDEFCERLKHEGARFYDSIQDSPEVIEMGLLDAEAALKRKPIPEFESPGPEYEHCR